MKKIKNDLKRFFKVGRHELKESNLCKVEGIQWKIKERIKMQLMDKAIPNQDASHFNKATLPKSSPKGIKEPNSELFGKNR